MIAELPISTVLASVEEETKRPTGGAVSELAKVQALRDEVLVSAARQLAEATRKIRHLESELKVLMRRSNPLH